MAHCDASLKGGGFILLGRKKFALSMLKDDFNAEIIIKHTGLLKEELQALAKEHGLKLKYSE